MNALEAENIYVLKFHKSKSNFLLFFIYLLFLLLKFSFNLRFIHNFIDTATPEIQVETFLHTIISISSNILLTVVRKSSVEGIKVFISSSSNPIHYMLIIKLIE